MDELIRFQTKQLNKDLYTSVRRALSQQEKKTVQTGDGLTDHE